MKHFKQVQTKVTVSARTQQIFKEAMTGANEVLTDEGNTNRITKLAFDGKDIIVNYKKPKFEGTLVFHEDDFVAMPGIPYANAIATLYHNVK